MANAKKPAKKSVKKSIKKAAAKPAKKPATKPAKKPAAKPATKPGSRADLGAPIAGYFTKLPPHTKPILEKLRDLILEVVPDAVGQIKWGMPHFTLDGHMMAAITGHKAHVNLILAGDPKSFDDPDERLEGTGTTGRHLKLTSLDELPADQIRGWLRVSAAHARS